MNPQAPNPAETAPTTSPTTPESPKTDSHGITIAALAVFILLALGAVAFLYYQNQQLKSMLANYQTVSSPVPIATPNPTANWTTYTDSKIGLSFKYPPTWSYKLGDSNSTTGSVIFDTGILNEDKQINYIFDVTLESQTNLDQWVAYESTVTLPTSSINDLTFEKYIAADMYYSLNYILKQNNKIIRFMVSPYDQSTYPKELDTNIGYLLSTFKFGSAASPSAKPVACTEEAKICPDGSAVGRSGPNCEFAPCPNLY